MEVILKSNNKEKIAKILALAKRLNIIVEKKDTVVIDKSDKEAIKQRILSFKSGTSSPFGDAAQWEREQREDRDLPF